MIQQTNNDDEKPEKHSAKQYSKWEKRAVSARVAERSNERLVPGPEQKAILTPAPPPDLQRRRDYHPGPVQGGTDHGQPKAGNQGDDTESHRHPLREEGEAHKVVVEIQEE